MKSLIRFAILVYLVFCVFQAGREWSEQSTLSENMERFKNDSIFEYQQFREFCEDRFVDIKNFFTNE